MKTPIEPSPFTARDQEQLGERGIAHEEALRQLAQLRQPPPALELDRPCTRGDGIDTLDEAARERLARRHAAAAADGEVCAFVPASGAASRMFKELVECAKTGRAWTRGEVEGSAEGTPPDVNARALRTFADGIDRFAFRDTLTRALAERGQRLETLRASGPYRPVLEALLEPDAMNYAALPKALILFHLEQGVAHTAFEEHLAEAAELYRDDSGTVRVHVTVPAGHRRRFEAVGDRFHASVAAATRFRIDYSVQDPATDTLAIDGTGEPFRDGGALLLRPAGHGALLANLALAPAPVVMIKNIDNIAAAPYREPTLEWTRAVVGLTLELRDEVHALVRRLRDTGDASAVAAAAAWLRDAGIDGAAAGAGREALIAALDRPVRVCGMVVNTGEPGGGPFWVRGRDGAVSRQIVESVQIDAANPTQAAVLGAATHFNPVYLACALDDADGRRHDLDPHVDADAAIVTRRSASGRELVALERPGLWNGGMARWITRFVEVPLTVFNPVKTVNDLLRREHQGTSP